MGLNISPLQPSSVEQISIPYCDNDTASCASLSSQSDVNHDSDAISNDYITNMFDSTWIDSSGHATLPLFEGSRSIVLQALVKHFHWFSSHPGISKEALSSMLAMEHGLLPDGNKIPRSYEEALKCIEPYLVQPVVYDVCIEMTV